MFKMHQSRLFSLMLAVLMVLPAAVIPQGFQVDNNTIATLGALAVVGGLAFAAGNQHGVRKGQRNPNVNGNGIFFSDQIFPIFGRRRRQAIPENELDPRVEDLFRSALISDSNNCGLRLVCQIGRKPQGSLSGHAKNLQGVLAGEHKESAVRDSARAAYLTARNLGRDGGDCEALFPRCTQDSHMLMNIFQTM